MLCWDLGTSWAVSWVISWVISLLVSWGHPGVILDLGSECLVLQSASADSDMLDGSCVDSGWAQGAPGAILGSSSDHPGVILGSSWDHHGSSWDHPKVILDSSWNHPGVILNLGSECVVLQCVSAGSGCAAWILGGPRVASDISMRGFAERFYWFWICLMDFRIILGSSWGHHGIIMVHPGVILGSAWIHPGIMPKSSWI